MITEDKIRADSCMNLLEQEFKNPLVTKDDGDEDKEKKRNAKAIKALHLAIVNSKELFVNEFGRPFAAMKISRIRLIISILVL